MRRITWQITIGWVLVIVLLLTGCADSTTLTANKLCPSSAGGSWVIVQPESLQFIDSKVDIGTLTNFRFLMVASNGKLPEDGLGCASAVVYPSMENMPVHSTLHKGDKMNISKSALVVDAKVLGDNKLYVYFVGINAPRAAPEINGVLGSAVQAIRRGLQQALIAPTSKGLGYDVTKFLLVSYPDYLKESDLVDYGAFAIQPNVARIGGYHATYSTNGAMVLEYKISLYEEPAEAALSKPTPETVCCNCLQDGKGGFTGCTSDGYCVPCAKSSSGTDGGENVIKNGNFEARWTVVESVAPYWQPYNNGQAHFGWYKELWDEAVRKDGWPDPDSQSQLLEIYQFAPNAPPDRMIAIYQTAEVVPNSSYDLTIYALMRTDTPPNLRTGQDYEMHWGIDYRGTGNYENVLQWVKIPLTEQARIGSNEPNDLNKNPRLFFESAKAAIYTANNSKITLFIRGVKKRETGYEVNFNIDDVSLIGPPPIRLGFPTGQAVQPLVTPTK